MGKMLYFFWKMSYRFHFYKIFSGSSSILVKVLFFPSSFIFLHSFFIFYSIAIFSSQATVSFLLFLHFLGKSRSSSPVLPRVEAKKALSREEQQTSARSSNFNQGKNFGGGGNIRTKKIFVGGLPPTLTEDGLISNSSAHDFLFALVIVMVFYSSSNRRGSSWMINHLGTGGEMLESSKVESSAHSWLNLSFLVGFVQCGVCSAKDLLS
ncbi:hypothetical protein ES332_A03G074700v1 [Gossypium tomentosum]|uniref:RRM domain-containing protein n=1 Tax=Gossypium tomentosum TaxID=34277 RepID=A0A5D2R7G9_GOSTO|nr:hypothetical protein ES332_A03G074700v1 [Gossypium tomentosum]TYI35414.1 hypothetical protein ES332_A03G074700v1 [Gossypium tomentosum]